MLAGFSGLYLFTLFTDPAALGGQTIQLSAITGGADIPSGDGPLSEADTARLKDSLRALEKQMAAIDTRLQAAEDYVAPVAALPEPETPPAEEPAPAADEPVEEVVVEETEVVEATPEPAAPEPVAAEPETAAPAVTAAPPAPEPEPAPPPPVVVAPPPPVTVDPPA
ncbi:hypothetical protein, partial [Methyloceanibacter superfactus]|uniref:hypothetical protein n=1 Tax=Methyloceanibacter superfactus TaxID=1774969 RepID=UPI0019587BA9